MTTATLRLIERVERLEMTGEIGDGTVAQLHELASLARLEQNPVDVFAGFASRAGLDVDEEWLATMRRYADEPMATLPIVGINAQNGRPVVAPRPCAAYLCGDQMLCPCGLAWDVDDTDPPGCPRGGR